MRTPKSKTSSRIWHAIHVTQWETAIGLICMSAGLLSFTTNPNWRTFSLCALLFWQGSLYLAAPVYSLLSMGRAPARAARIIEQGSPVLEQWAARWVVVVSMILISAFSLMRILPVPAELPDYARFLPIEISPLQLIEPDNPSTDTTTDIPTGTAVATVSVESANCRSRPRGGADRVTIFYSGQQLEIVGRNADLSNPWWYVKIPSSGGNCWLWGMTARTTGALEGIPIIE